MRSHFAEQAELLADAGVDLLILEMMRDIDNSCAALEAAAATSLPVWVGFSCERTEEGNLKLAPPIAEEIALDAGVAAVMAEGGELAAVMHSDVDVTGAALAAIQAVWDGPTGAYPESGYFTMPNWQFVDHHPAGRVRRRSDGLGGTWRATGGRLLRHRPGAHTGSGRAAALF